MQIHIDWQCISLETTPTVTIEIGKVQKYMANEKLARKYVYEPIPE